MHLRNVDLHGGEHQVLGAFAEPGGGADNRITTSGYAYDAAGNMTTIAGISGSLSYNAEKQLVGAAGMFHLHDGDGRRVRKRQNQGESSLPYWRLCWYPPTSLGTGGLGGEALQETNATSGLLHENVFFKGQRVARRDSSGAVSYYFAVH
ncbi:MAG: hypothetical protein ACRD4D_04675 [Candidatus Acidiferrales bacterium]